VSDLKLFKVDLDGCVIYYVAALQPDDCLDLIKAIEGSDMFEPDTEVTTSVITEDRAKGILIRNDDKPGKDPLWEILKEMTQPGVIACSEW